MREVFIVGTARTPIGKFQGSLAGFRAPELGAIAIKEAVARSKVALDQVDEVILDHPAVEQVVTFAVPHPKLGEDVAAAVVLKAGQSLTERELQQFVGTRLADMKVPRKVLFLAEIPKGATGKLQRIGLAARLGLA